MLARGLSQCCEVWRIVGFALLRVEFMFSQGPVMPVLAFRPPFFLPQGICLSSDLLLAAGCWRPAALPVDFVCGSPSHLPSACVRGGWSFRPAAVSRIFACLASCWLFHEGLLADLNQIGRSKFQTKSASSFRFREAYAVHQRLHRNARPMLSACRVGMLIREALNLQMRCHNVTRLRHVLAGR